MEGNHVVHDISSDDDDVAFDWSKFAVNPESGAVGDQNCDKGYDSDDVVVVSEFLPKAKRAKKASDVFVAEDPEDDDDCVILDGDPDKPTSVEIPGPDSGADSDDLVIVSEKGQVACRDYPHPRHLCVKFPFDSTQHSVHCKLCHCYVCDSPAPCFYWGRGNMMIDHCHANEKEELWKSERKRAKLERTPSVVSSADTSFWRDLLKQIPTPDPPLAQNSGFPAQAPSFGVPNIIRSQRAAGVSGRHGLHSNIPSRPQFNPRVNHPQRSTSMLKPTSGPLVKSLMSSKASNNSSQNNLRNAYASNLAGINVRHVHEFHMSCAGGAININTIQTSPTASANHISQVQVDLTAGANSTPYLHPNENGNAPGSSTAHQQPPLTEEIPNPELNIVFNEADAQFFQNLPPFDFEDEHLLHDIDQLWPLL